jgi:hypothetical protein
VAIETGPCEMGTGRAEMGTHLLLKAKGKELNIHLGPEPAVDHVADLLTVGKKVKVAAFRTPKMPDDHYVAQRLKVEDRWIPIRDADLRPLWAGSGARWSGRGGRPGEGGWARCSGGGPPPWAGRGRGRGRGAGGLGRGRNGGLGPGAGWGRGRAYGRGWGRQWGFVDQDNDGVCDRLQSPTINQP